MDEKILHDTILLLRLESNRRFAKIRREELTEKYHGNLARIERALSRDRFRLPEELIRLQMDAEYWKSLLECYRASMGLDSDVSFMSDDAVAWKRLMRSMSYYFPLLDVSETTVSSWLDMRLYEYRLSSFVWSVELEEFVLGDKAELNGAKWYTNNLGLHLSKNWRRVQSTPFLEKLYAMHWEQSIAQWCFNEETVPMLIGSLSTELSNEHFEVLWCKFQDKYPSESKPLLQKSERLQLDYLIDTVEDGGSLYLMVGKAFLTRLGVDMEYRKQLLGLGYIRGVMQLPTQLFAHASDGVCLLHVEKQMSEREEMYFEDLSEAFVQKEGLRCFDKAMAKQLRTENKAVFVDYEVLERESFQWLPSVYLRQHNMQKISTLEAIKQIDSEAQQLSDALEQLMFGVMDSVSDVRLQKFYAFFEGMDVRFTTDELMQLFEQADAYQLQEKDSVKVAEYLDDLIYEFADSHGLQLPFELVDKMVLLMER